MTIDSTILREIISRAVRTCEAEGDSARLITLFALLDALDAVTERREAMDRREQEIRRSQTG